MKKMWKIDQIGTRSEKEKSTMKREITTEKEKKIHRKTEDQKRDHNDLCFDRKNLFNSWMQIVSSRKILQNAVH